MTTSENPSIYFGGTWEETAKGVALLELKKVIVAYLIVA